MAAIARMESLFRALRQGGLFVAQFHAAAIAFKGEIEEGARSPAARTRIQRSPA